MQRGVWVVLSYLEPFLADLGAIFCDLGAILGDLGAIWGALGAVLELGYDGAILEVSWVVWGHADK